MPKEFHPEELALLAAIHANPREDTPRLVLADWLQEHDQEEYAEFIRLHCQHPAVAVQRGRGEPWKIVSSDAALESVAARLGELVKRKGDEWYRPFPRNRVTSLCWFHRGLPMSGWPFDPSHVVRDTKAILKRLVDHHQLALHLMVSKYHLPRIPWDNPLFKRATRLLVRPDYPGMACSLSDSLVHHFAKLPFLSRFKEVMFIYVDREVTAPLPDNFTFWDDGALSQSIRMVIGQVHT